MPALVLDDDPDYAAMIGLVCRRLGLEPRHVDDPAQLVDELARHGGHLVVADAASLGDVAGIAGVRRTSRVPLVVLGGVSAERILDAGADHHLPKPFPPGLLRLTAQVALRRSSAVTPLARHRVPLGGVDFEPGRRRLVGPRGRLALTVREADLLEFLALHAGRVVSRGQIVEGAWGGIAEATDTAVVSAVYRLRRKLGAAGSSARLLTAPGHGYRLVLAGAGADTSLHGIFTEVAGYSAG